jgi:two-component system chemotaxis response regulator CheY
MADVLLIDDMVGVRRAVDAMLKRAGHRVTAVTNGAEGLAQLKQRSFDLVIVDILMPQVDGTEVISQLNAMPNRPPVIAISGGGAGISANEALHTARFKADAFLEKPFDKDQFETTVAKLLAKHA